MQLNPRNAAVRVQSAVCVLAVTVGLTAAPALISTADAAGSRNEVTAQCTAARSALTQARTRQAAAKKDVAKAAKALAKAKKAHKPAKVKKAKVKKAKKSLAKARSTYTARTRAVQVRQNQATSACKAAPAPDEQSKGAGEKLSLLALAGGLPLDSLDLGQVAALLEQLLPGITDNLSADQLAGLLAGFNGGTDLDPSDVLALLAGVVPPDAIASILGGSASPEVITDLISDLIGQLSGLAGGFPIPTSLDPTGLWETFSGIFGTLGADQLGSLLALLTSALGGADSFDLAGLTDLIDSLVPGISDQFDPTQLTSMLGALNGSGLSASTLSNLLGGQFSPTQITSLLSGSAGPALIGQVITQVMAQLATAGGGGLQLPGALDPSAITGLISTVTSLISSITGGGGGVLPVVCGLIPIPVLCS